MTADRWERLRAYYHDALDLDQAGRAALLAGVRNNDFELHSELEALLAEQPEEGFLEELDWAEEAYGRFIQGEQLGPYRLVREIGRGGMGIVFEAVREEEGVRKTVAIKVLTASVLDRDSARQFRLERKALSELDHPNIAQLLDWGETLDHQAYLVMEYVRDAGPISEFCKGGSRTAAQILRLLLQVCDAVAHAHGHLVIHRDLKPANILVTDEGRVKLLDFGIAKLLDSPEGATRTVWRRLTPAYAAPEQIVGEPVSTASDVYSLGVLAYELLSGCLPYASQLRNDQIVWAVVNETPKPPSEAAGITPHRRRELQGDLDKITLKALEKDPLRRYSSVEALANDIRNHLQGRAVVAQGDTWSYRARKFMRRNRAGVAAVMVVALSLATGAGVAIWKARIADRERARAEEQLRDLEKLSHSLIFDLHDLIADLPGATKARRELVSTALRYLDRLSVEAAGNDAVQLDLAAAYQKIAAIQDQPFEPTVGDSEIAMKSYDKARSILLAYWRRHPFEPRAGTLLFSSWGAWLIILDPATALRLADQDMRLADAWVAARPGEPQAMRALAQLDETRAQVRSAAGDFSGSLEDSTRATQLLQQAIQRSVGDWSDYLNLASEGVNRGWAFARMGAIGEALAAYDSADANSRRASSMTSTNVRLDREMAVSDGRRSQLFLQQGKTHDAEIAIRRSMKMLSSLAAADPMDYSARRDLAVASVRYGRVLMALDRKQSAIQELESAVHMFEALPRADFNFNDFYADSLNELGMARLKAAYGQSLDCLDHAAQFFRSALELTQRALQLAPSNIELLRQRARAYHGLAEVARIRSGRPEIAAKDRERYRAEAVQMLRHGIDDWHLLRQRSPLYREGADEQVAMEHILQSLPPR
jgi:non-specific serine/threonine protein kinase/serine/threonine-protein kinase